MAALPDFPSNLLERDLSVSFPVSTQDLKRLSRLHALITQHADALLDSCHCHRGNVSSNNKTLNRLKILQRSYLEKLISEESDLNRIEILQEQIALSPDFAVESYAKILSQMLPLVLVQFNSEPLEQQAILATLIKVFHFDMLAAREAHTRKTTEKQMLNIQKLRQNPEGRRTPLENAKSHFRSIFENVSIPLITYGPTGEILRWNRPFEILLQCAAEKIEGRYFYELLAGKSSKKRMTTMVKAVFAGEELTEIHWKIKTNSGLFLDLSVSTFPVCDANQRVSFGIAMFVDVTEKNELERALLHTQKMAAMGTLASGLAHELGTPMNVILGRAESLLRQTKEKKTALGLMIIIEQIDRMTHLINRLLAFARKTPIERKKIALNTLITKSLELIEQRATAKGILVSLDLENELYPIWGEGEQILQVLVNLLMNAVDAIHHGGKISIKTSSMDMSRQGSPRRGSTAKLKRMVQILVEDNGSGIDDVLLDKIFDPFFTTKAVGKGTGLGLAVASGIVRDHSGQIEVASSKQGTTFCVRLPAEALDSSA